MDWFIIVEYFIVSITIQTIPIGIVNSEQETNIRGDFDFFLVRVNSILFFKWTIFQNHLFRQNIYQIPGSFLRIVIGPDSYFHRNSHRWFGGKWWYSWYHSRRCWCQSQRCWWFRRYWTFCGSGWAFRRNIFVWGRCLPQTIKNIRMRVMYT